MFDDLIFPTRPVEFVFTKPMMTQWLVDRSWKLDESTESGLAVWILRPTSGSMDPPEELSTPPHTPGYDPPQPVWRKWGCRIYIVDEDDAENVENDDDAFQSIPSIQSCCVSSTGSKRCIQNPEAKTQNCEIKMQQENKAWDDALGR